MPPTSIKVILYFSISLKKAREECVSSTRLTRSIFQGSSEIYISIIIIIVSSDSRICLRNLEPHYKILQKPFSKANHYSFKAYQLSTLSQHFREISRPTFLIFPLPPTWQASKSSLKGGKASTSNLGSAAFPMRSVAMDGSGDRGAGGNDVSVVRLGTGFSKAVKKVHGSSIWSSVISGV